MEPVTNAISVILRVLRPVSRETRMSPIDRATRLHLLATQTGQSTHSNQQAEGISTLDLEQASLGGIPSLDFRPVLQLYAPEDAKLQISPCDECGGTMEVLSAVHHRLP